MTRKQIIIISSIIVVAVLIFVYYKVNTRVETIILEDYQVDSYEPEFMNEQEKTKFNLPQDSEIQVLKRADDGSITVYKIIRDDSDVETNLEDLGQPIY